MKTKLARSDEEGRIRVRISATIDREARMYVEEVAERMKAYTSVALNKIIWDAMTKDAMDKRAAELAGKKKGYP